ncbi:MAG: ComEC/Rec2 family competence protein, partial [Bacilli bacterium]|nr:ComEC/Rec2 family competence protein [Bacilli bacterium]
MKRLRHILQSKHLIKIITIIIFIITLLYTNYYPFKSKYTKDDKEFIGIVTKYEVKEDKITIEIKAKEKLLITYKYQDKEFNNLSYGDKIKVKGTLITPSKNTNQNTFNYQKYLYYKKIYYLVEATSINKIANNNNYLYTIKNTLYQKIDKLKSSNYIKTLLFCDNTLSKEIKESYRINGISHLFSVSGMHINFFVSIIYLYLNKITYNKRIKYLITNIFIITYLILFPSSSLLRSAVMSILYSINYLLKLKIKKIDILLLTLVVSLLINPFIIYDLGYIYSYTITFFLVLSSSTLKKKNKINKIIYISLLSFLVSIPITIYNSFEINIISILLNIILVPIISIIILPLTILTYIFPILDSILYLFTNTLETISLFISKINITKIIFPKPSLLIIVLYYIIFLLSYQNKKYFYLNIILLIIIYISPYLNSNFEVVMFEVGEADCHLIKYPYNKNTILIDTGKNEYKIKNEVIPYLKSIGIKKIDYLIITHGDEDHIGGSITLINNFQVKNVILNKGTFTDIEKELIKNLNKKKIPYQININKINLSNHTIYLLNNTKYNNENDNSIITYFTYQKYKFLHMGDASITTED